MSLPGLARRLFARARQVRLLFLDTSDGHGGARAFYDAIGYSYVGGIPGYALDPDGATAGNESVGLANASTQMAPAV